MEEMEGEQIMAVTFSLLEDNRELIQNASDEAINRALMAIGLQVENYARNNAPVDTGALRNSITSEVLSNEHAVIIGSNIDYAPYQELGTSRMGACNGGRGFLRPAVEDHLSEFEDITLNELQNG